MSSWRASADFIASRCCSHRRVEPSRSVNKKVTVPVGRSAIAALRDEAIECLDGALRCLVRFPRFGLRDQPFEDPWPDRALGLFDDVLVPAHEPEGARLEHRVPGGWEHRDAELSFSELDEHD